MEVTYRTSFKDELKSCRMLTAGVAVCTAGFMVLFLASLVRGSLKWHFLLFAIPLWTLFLPKKIGVSSKGIVWRGRLISWEELEFAGEENGKLVFKHRDLEFRIPKKVVQRVDWVKACS